MTDDNIIDHLTDRVLEQIAGAVPWRPGARELLASIRDAGIPTAVVTMSISRMARHIVSLAPEGSFDFVVAGDDVEHSKPHPAPYLHAAKLLGVEAQDCVAIEDSTTGLASAVASGAVAIGVPLHSVLDEGLGYTIWPTLAGRTVVDIVELFASSRAGVA
jgi:HAD superfamily hydrolase (TIGR01509 family)